MLIRGIQGRVGLRGIALIGLGLLDLIYAYGLLNPPKPVTPTYRYPNAIIDLCWWALLWSVVGALLLFYAFRRHDTVAFTAAIMLKAGWGLLLLLGWVGGSIDRGYVSASIWLVFAACVYVIMAGVEQQVIPTARQDDS
jgi:hypothetical protein